MARANLAEISGRAGSRDSQPSMVKVPVRLSTKMVTVSFSSACMVSVEDPGQTMVRDLGAMGCHPHTRLRFQAQLRHHLLHLHQLVCQSFLGDGGSTHKIRFYLGRRGCFHERKRGDRALLAFSLATGLEAAMARGVSWEFFENLVTRGGLEPKWHSHFGNYIVNTLLALHTYVHYISNQLHSRQARATSRRSRRQKPRSS